MKTAALISLLLLASCATQKPAGAFCDISRPIRLTEQTIDAMSDAEVRDVLSHNKKGQALCGWAP